MSTPTASTAPTTRLKSAGRLIRRFHPSTLFLGGALLVSILLGITRLVANVSGSTAPGSSLAYSSGLEVALYAALILFSGVFTVIVFSQELRRLKFEDTIVAPGVRMTGPFSLQISSQFAVPGEVSTVSRAWDEDGSTSIITTDSHVTTIITEACCNTTTITTRPKGEPVA